MKNHFYLKVKKLMPLLLVLTCMAYSVQSMALNKPTLKINKTNFSRDAKWDGYYYIDQAKFTYDATGSTSRTLCLYLDGRLISRTALIGEASTYTRTLLYGGNYEACIEAWDGKNKVVSDKITFTAASAYKALDAAYYVRSQIRHYPRIIDISSFNVPISETSYFVENIWSENGWVSVSDNGTILTKCELHYGISEEQNKQMWDYIDNTLAALLPEDATDLQKAVIIYSYFGTYSNTEYYFGPHCYDIYGFVERETVCDGIAKAFAAFCEEAGLNCIKGGSGDIGHSWNVIEIDGIWGQTDITWDAQDAGDGHAGFGNFMCTDNEFIDSHTSQHQEITWSCSGVKFPACTSAEYRSGYEFGPDKPGEFWYAPDGRFYTKRNGNTWRYNPNTTEPLGKLLKIDDLPPLDYLTGQVPSNAYLTVPEKVALGKNIYMAAGAPFNTKVKDYNMGYACTITYDIQKDGNTITTITGAPFEISYYEPQEKGEYTIVAHIKNKYGETSVSKNVTVADIEKIELDLSISTVNIHPNGYEYNGEFVDGDYDYIITGSTTKNLLNFYNTNNTNVTLRDVNIDLRGERGTEETHSAIFVSDASVNLILEGDNKLYAGNDRSAIYMEGDCAATINGEGSLYANGDWAWAAITCVDEQTLTINGGNITAEGGDHGAGIGGSWGRIGGNIIINGGTVTALGGYSSAGIGSGHETDAGKTPIINGGSVKSTGLYAFGGGWDGQELTPLNSDGTRLTLQKIDNTWFESLTVKGKEYGKPNGAHPSDNMYYLYLPASGDAVLNGVPFRLEDGWPITDNIENMENAEGLSATGQNGTIVLTVDKAQQVNVCSIDGVQIFNAFCSEGQHMVNNVNRGVYIVNGKKIVVR